LAAVMGAWMQWDSDAKRKEGALGGHPNAPKAGLYVGP